MTTQHCPRAPPTAGDKKSEWRRGAGREEGKEITGGRELKKGEREGEMDKDRTQSGEYSESTETRVEVNTSEELNDGVRKENEKENDRRAIELGEVVGGEN